MALFQKSVLKKYLKSLDEKKVTEAYQKFTAFFHDPTTIQNIRDGKEEQFQYGFLQNLFDAILGYTIYPKPNYNLTTEFKNLKGAKKADGAILKDGKAVGVVELKSTNTKEISKITDQAFGYKNNHPTCVYVITSNFEKLRFYINDAVDYLDFDLFTLNQEGFKLLYLCLHKDHILGDLPQRIKKDSALQEENVTKKLYKDYSEFKKALFNDLTANNPDIPKLTLFKKSQKLIDRFLFILFAEDKGLLPPNSVTKIVKTFDALEDLDNYKPLYEVFKQYFGYINTGRPARKDKSEIFAFNGGLFAPDEVLDNLKITDAILMNHTLLLSAYDFESEVDVNILGHIFEHSLNEIDEMTAEIEGKTIDKSKTKRKKDGVFYTPKYITKYIVDNTVGKLCEEKKEELNLSEDEYRPNRNKSTKKKLLGDLEAYRSYLLGLTICDPACGSGAFLNQSLDFLIKEHRYIDELQTKLLGGSIVLSDITNDILERNIYGVDINEESVEIARLSLWLRTAQKGRALTTLSNNIKCGNSLIDDPTMAGDKAFKWEEEFPEVFERGGFDVVIGNPPYVRQELIKPFKPFLQERYKTFQGTADLFTYFIEISIDRLLNKNGLYSIIVANKWMRANYGKPLRNWMKEKRIIEIIDFGDLPVFADATAYPCILTLSPKNAETIFWATEPKTLDFSDLELFVKNNHFKVKTESLAESGWALVDERVSDLLDKLKSKGKTLKDYANGKIYRGVLTGLNEAFVIDKETREKLIKEDPKSAEIIKPFLAGRDVKRYSISFQETYLLLFPCGWTNQYKGENEAWDFIQKSYPAIANYLENFEEKARKRYDQGNYWWELRACDYYEEFEKPKIIYAEIATKGQYCFDIQNYFVDTTAYIVCLEKIGIIGLFNSSMWTFLVRLVSSEIRGGFLRWKRQYLEGLPIPNGLEQLEPFVEKQNKLTADTNLLMNKFQRLIKRKFTLEKLPKKLQNWHILTYAEFIKELKKKKIKLSLKEEADWEEYFEEEKAKAQALQQSIEATDKEIDGMVYELYGLTEEEIEIVENS